MLKAVLQEEVWYEAEIWIYTQKSESTDKWINEGKN